MILLDDPLDAGDLVGHAPLALGRVAIRLGEVSAFLLQVGHGTLLKRPDPNRLVGVPFTAHVPLPEPHTDPSVERPESASKDLAMAIEFFWIIGLVVLAAAIFYFGTRQRRLTRAEQKRSDQAARENWGKEEIR